VLDPERRLALIYAPAKFRPALAALWSLDATLGRIVAARNQPIVTQMKLAWWRDALLVLDSGRVAAEPVLQAFARDALPQGVGIAAASDLAGGWEILAVAEQLTPELLSSYAELRGRRLFDLSAQALGGEPAEWIARAGEGWALIDLGRRSTREDEAEAAFAEARARLLRRQKWPARLRSLGMLSILARRDARRGRTALESPGAPARQFRMLAHRITGL